MHISPDAETKEVIFTFDDKADVHTWGKTFAEMSKNSRLSPETRLLSEKISDSIRKKQPVHIPAVDIAVAFCELSIVFADGEKTLVMFRDLLQKKTEDEKKARKTVMAKNRLDGIERVNRIEEEKDRIKSLMPECSDKNKEAIGWYLVDVLFDTAAITYCDFDRFGEFVHKTVEGKGCLPREVVDAYTRNVMPKENRRKAEILSAMENRDTVLSWAETVDKILAEEKET